MKIFCSAAFANADEGKKTCIANAPTSSIGITNADERRRMKAAIKRGKTMPASALPSVSRLDGKAKSEKFAAALVKI